jgi:hypothetical protein
MSPEDKLSRLQELLERVRKNASAPRPVAVATAAPAAVAAPAAAAPTNGGAAVAPADEWPEAPESIPSSEAELMDVELLDEDILDVTPDEELEPAEVAPEPAPPEPELVAAAAPVDDAPALEFEEPEELPASSRRPTAAAASMDEALASAAEQIDLDAPDEAPAPLMTPPPESGRQVAGPASDALGAPAVPDELEKAEPADEEPAEFELPEAPAVPTAEQLGETIELEVSDGPELELAAPVEPEPKPAPDTLEAPIPASESPGEFDQALVPPPEARVELERHRQKVGPEQPAASAGGPEVVQRRPLPAEALPATYAGEAQAFRPNTFLELLEASLKL